MDVIVEFRVKNLIELYLPFLLGGDTRIGKSSSLPLREFANS